MIHSYQMLGVMELLTSNRSDLSSDRMFILNSGLWYYTLGMNDSGVCLMVQMVWTIHAEC